MEEQVFEARLGNVDVVDRRAGCFRRDDDRRNQHAAAIGVEIHLPFARRARFGHARQRPQPVYQRRRRAAEVQAYEKAPGDRALSSCGVPTAIILP